LVILVCQRAARDGCIPGNRRELGKSRKFMPTVTEGEGTQS
jgi:hypothetical protein